MSEQPSWTDGKSINIRELLRAAANGDAVADDFLSNEMTGFRRVLPDFEPAVIDATSWSGIANNRPFLISCAEFLIWRRSEWEGLAGLVAELVGNGTDYSSLKLATGLASYWPKNLPDSFYNSVWIGFNQLALWERWMLWLDGPIRNLVRQSRLKLGLASGPASHLPPE